MNDILAVAATTSDASFHRSKDWLEGQKEAFEAVMNGAPLAQSLDVLIKVALSQVKSIVRCAFYIANAAGSELTHVTGMPASYARLVEGFEIGPEFLACVLAMGIGEPMITPDVECEPRWQSWLWLARDFGFRGCWSFPVRTSGGKLVGTFALYFEAPREITDEDRELADHLVKTASMIIAHHQSQEQIRKELEDAKRLQTISLELIHDGRHDALYQTILEGAAAIMRSDFASLQVLHPDRGESGELSLLAHKGFTDATVRSFEWVRVDSASICGQALRAGGREVVYDIDSADTMRGTADLTIYRQAGIRAIQTTPLYSRAGAVIGMLSTHWAKPHVPSEREFQLLDVVARQAADVMERQKVEAALRQSEERQAFLLMLSDTLTRLDDPLEVMKAASRLLGDHICADKTVYEEIVAEKGKLRLQIHAQHVRRGQPFPAQADYDAVSRGWVGDTLRQGQPVVVADISADPRLAEDVRKSWLLAGTQAIVVVSLLRNGREAVNFGVQQSGPRAWTAAEVAIVAEVAERTWAAAERARAEAALKRSEDRFQRFAAASRSAIWIRNARTFDFEYAGPAIEMIYGVSPETVMKDERALGACIVPEERDVVSKRVARVAQGESIVQEYRIQRSSEDELRWIRSIGFPIYDENGDVTRIGGIAEDVTEAKRAIQHREVLLAELQHRVRNIMAVIRAINCRTADSVLTVEEYRDVLAGRLEALARVQALLTQSASQEISIDSILRSEVGAKDSHAHQYRLSGPDVHLSAKACEVITLALHELSTNSLKYGALSMAKGRVEISWRVMERSGRSWLSFEWSELGGPPVSAARRRGFGTELIEDKIPYELTGHSTMTFEPEGFRCLIEFPLKAGDSILETGAPKPAGFVAEALDAGRSGTLTGQTVLVVEDDFHLAADTAGALRDAGAVVCGPYGNEDVALQALNEGGISLALLDINLGRGASFVIAKALAMRDIPFLFVTGYDDDVIPGDYQDVARLQKPVQRQQIILAMAGLAAAGSKTDVL
ncbi:hypothetical protein ATY81_25405 [Rhizobium sp. R72]|uniref:GAF domain-containing protein n=1 Tax=unclassified Rhizobium TaxID=2613769 RepID=UPI000B52A939|nr:MULTISPECIES: GAF domain-containing protein [unclassified Rhizobium]OWW00132.1 hypothetical protein ATY81_25405 [Rhizobium sp. R72]OWW00523.1 hypothetical protein ATY80_25405 [Rhizobium sp. R711]